VPLNSNLANRLCYLPSTTMACSNLGWKYKSIKTRCTNPVSYAARTHFM